jgi:RimJ/RimL family protein N-acetyltransferase
MEEARFAGPDPGKIGFERLKTSDLPLMHRWLNAPHVARWWYAEGSTYSEVEETYVPCIEGRDPTEPYLILYDGFPIGYVQTYRISDDPDYARLVQVENSADVDMFVGEEEFLHKGLGSHILRRFLGEVVFVNDDVEDCVIGPEPKNAAAIRAFEKADCRYFKTIQVPGETEPEYLMRIPRESVMT